MLKTFSHFYCFTDLHNFIFYITPKADFPISAEHLKIKNMNFFLYMYIEIFCPFWLFAGLWSSKTLFTSVIAILYNICILFCHLSTYIVQCLSQCPPHVCVCIAGVTVPTLHVGMLFTTCCWYRDPHGLPWVEYLHTGANKIW